MLHMSALKRSEAMWTVQQAIWMHAQVLQLGAAQRRLCAAHIRAERAWQQLDILGSSVLLAFRSVKGCTCKLHELPAF